MPPEPVIIDYLKNHPSSISVLARYSYQEWKTVYDRRGLNFDDAVRSYSQRTNVDALPLALVAIDRETIIGTGSLKLQDLDARPDYTPWLGGVFVAPTHRRRGIAAMLIDRLIQEARRLRITQLYLWTPSAVGLYAKFGWIGHETLSYCGFQITVMKKQLCPPRRAAVQNRDRMVDLLLD